MPWVKSFDVDDALSHAMHAFWAKGYEATSMQNLVDCMGINRGSIYATFGSKRELFIRALKSYDREYRERQLGALAAELPPRAAVLAAFHGAAETAVGEGNRDGCLLVNAALELSPHDEEIAALVAEGLRGTEDFFRTMIEKGQRRQEISPTLDANRAAQALLGLFIGLRVLARSRPEKAVMDSILAQAKVILAGGNS